MCRICGVRDFHENINYDLKAVSEKMRDTMAHGGPDGAGVYYCAASGVALGHRRLSIIDLSSSGHQPMKFKNYAAVYNGEIYNFASVKAELASYGRKFISNSDTEVLLQAYDEWGLSCVDKFRGMWAFALWDETQKTLTLSRDRFGVKPLYWYHKDGLFMFSSELKAFCAHPTFDKKLDYNAVSLYLQHGYIASPLSIFENTYKLEPGHFLKIDARGNIKKIEYWSAEKVFTEGIAARRQCAGEEAVAEELEALLLESFKLRMVSDVPVGMFLSGGVDSSLLTALLAKDMGGSRLKTFTIGFKEKEYDEAGWAGRVAAHLGTEHTQLYCGPSDAFDIIPKLPQIYDEPLGDPSAVPTYLVSKLARTKVKVSLSADGGDEQFCGYSRYSMINERVAKFATNPFLGLISGALEYVSAQTAYSIYEKLPRPLQRWNNFYDKFTKLKKVLKTKNKIAQYNLANKYFLEEDLARLGLSKVESQLFKFGRGLEKMSLLDQMMYFDIKTYLPDDILVKVDRAAMSVALEGREPFLDHKIIEFAARLPIDLKYKNGVSKYILKKILYRHVPRKLADRPKQGFGVPVYEWFRDELKGCYREHLAFDKIKREGIFDAAEVSRLLGDYMNGRGVNAYKLWFLFVFELWYEKYMRC